MSLFPRAVLFDDLFQCGLFGRSLGVGQQLSWIGKGLSIVRRKERLDGLMQRILIRDRAGNGAQSNLEAGIMIIAVWIDQGTGFLSHRSGLSDGVILQDG